MFVGLMLRQKLMTGMPLPRAQLTIGRECLATEGQSYSSPAKARRLPPRRLAEYMA
jgi:hypothetical protein